MDTVAIRAGTGDGGELAAAERADEAVVGPGGGRPRRRWGRGILRAAVWFAVGVVVTIAMAWGCILWRVYVVSAWAPGAGTTLVAATWPFEVGEFWQLPTTVDASSGLGYLRLHSAGIVHHMSDGRWLTVEAFTQECNAAQTRALALLPAEERTTPTDTPEAQLREQIARIRRLEAQVRAITDTLELQIESSVGCFAFQRKSGWPFLALESRFVTLRPSKSKQTRYVVGEEFSEIGSARASWRQFYDRGILWPTAWGNAIGTTFTLPLRPVWPWFGVNAILWGAASWGVWRGLGAWRERRRLKVGQCVTCRYQVDDLAVCPECGAANANASAMMPPCEPRR
jgi:hypothetical protein